MYYPIFHNCQRAILSIPPGVIEKNVYARNLLSVLNLVELKRIELLTSCLQSRRSTKLSYSPVPKIGSTKVSYSPKLITN